MADKYGFIYVWFNRRAKRFYVGSHWGSETDGYICSSKWMRTSYYRNPQDFKRRVVKRLYNIERKELYEEEQRWLDMIKPNEIKIKYYNLHRSVKDPWYMHDEKRLTIGQKISLKKKGKSTGPCSPEKARRISEAKKAAFEARREQGIPTRKSSKGYKRGLNTEESNRKRSETLKARWATNEHHNTGRKLTEEHKAKIVRKKIV